MFLRRIERRKNGKTHLYWSVVENKRLDGGGVVQRHVLFGRDQFVAGGGVAQGDRGVRRGRGQLSDAGLVPGGPLRGRGGRRLGGAAANFGNAPASSATVGRLLVGGPVVARAATRPVLGGAPAGEPEVSLSWLISSCSSGSGWV